MAKQKTTGQGVVEALKGVSATEGNMGAVYGAAFKSGLDPVIAKSTARKKEREAENKAILKAAGAYLQGLDSNVDTVGLDFSDEDKAEVKRVSIEWRNEFADYANQLARIEDKTSAEALELQDKMNGIKSRFNNLRANLEGVAKYKQEFSLNIDLDGDGKGRTLYSGAGANKERLAQGKTILTESFTIDNEGRIVYPDQTISEEVPLQEVELDEFGNPKQGATKTVTKVTTPGFTYQHNNFKKPFEQAVNTVNGLTALYEQQASKEGPITDGEKKALTELINKLFTAPGALESFIADNDQLTEIFDFTDISLDDDDRSREEVQSEVVNRLVEAMAGARKPKSRSSQQQPLTTIKREAREKAYSENQIQIQGPRAGQRWIAFTEDGKKITYEGGVLTTNEKPAYYVLYDDVGPVPNYRNVPVNNIAAWQAAN